KQHVPKPWTLYVNSTSPNRSIPVGVSALIRVATSATSVTSVATPRTSRKGPPSDDDDEEDDDDDDDPQVKFLKFQSQFGNNQQLALQGCSTFLKYSKSFRVPKSGGGGGGQWLVVLVDNKSVFRTWDAIREWPRAFVGEEPQLVSAAFFDEANSGNTPLKLTGVFTFSPTGDETSVYYLEGFDDYEFLKCIEQTAEMQGCTCANDSLSVSSGDYGEKSLNCPALECITSAAMIGLSDVASSMTASANVPKCDIKGSAVTKQEKRAKDDGEDDGDDIACVGDEKKFIARFSRKDFARRGLEVFLSRTKAYRVPRTKRRNGQRYWIVLVLEDDETYMRWEDIFHWPRAFGGNEAQLVSGAVFTEKKKRRHKMWDIACVGDVTKFFSRFARKDFARRGLEAFLSRTKAYRVPRTKQRNGQKDWIVLVLEDSQTYSLWEDILHWPRAFGGNEAQLVSGAVFTDSSPPILTAVFTFSTTADETSLFFTKEGDDAEFFETVIERVEEQGCRCAEDALSPSSGDYEVDVLHCPALQLVTSANQFTFANQTKNGTGSKGAAGGGAAAAENWKLVANPNTPRTFHEICVAEMLPYSHGCGCYELVKSEKVSKDKFLVAMNEDNGEIIEGGDVVRARLGLPSGDANIGKQHVPKPWTLYVNSTSPNRKVPVGVSALIRVGASAPPKASKKAPAKRSRDDDDEDDDDEEDDGCYRPPEDGRTTVTVPQRTVEQPPLRQVLLLWSRPRGDQESVEVPLLLFLRPVERRNGRVEPSKQRCCSRILFSVPLRVQ
ncbi:Hypothetical protein, putative, partial [Bodo saltans]